MSAEIVGFNQDYDRCVAEVVNIAAEIVHARDDWPQERPFASPTTDIAAQAVFMAFEDMGLIPEEFDKNQFSRRLHFIRLGTMSGTPVTKEIRDRPIHGLEKSTKIETAEESDKVVAIFDPAQAYKGLCERMRGMPILNADQTQEVYDYLTRLAGGTEAVNMGEALWDTTRLIIADEACKASGVRDALEYYASDLSPQQREELYRTFEQAVVRAVGFTELIGVAEGDVVDGMAIYNAGIAAGYDQARTELKGGQ